MYIIKSEKTTRELIDLSQMRIKVVINEFLLFCMFDPFHHFFLSLGSINIYTFLSYQMREKNSKKVKICMGRAQF